jgi:hypothetical protein
MATALAFVTAAWLGLRHRVPPSSPAAAGEVGRIRIVVFPFENLGAADDSYFAAGMTEEVTSRLAGVRALAVASRTTAVEYDRRGKTLKQVGADLGWTSSEGTVRWDRPRAARGACGSHHSSSARRTTLICGQPPTSVRWATFSAIGRTAEVARSVRLLAPER